MSGQSANSEINSDPQSILTSSPASSMPISSDNGINNGTVGAFRFEGTKEESDNEEEFFSNASFGDNQLMRRTRGVSTPAPNVRPLQLQRGRRAAAQPDVQQQKNVFKQNANEFSNMLRSREANAPSLLGATSAAWDTGTAQIRGDHTPRGRAIPILDAPPGDTLMVTPQFPGMQNMIEPNVVLVPPEQWTSFSQAVNAGVNSQVVLHNPGADIVATVEALSTVNESIVVAHNGMERTLRQHRTNQGSATVHLRELEDSAQTDAIAYRDAEISKRDPSTFQLALQEHQYTKKGREKILELENQALMLKGENSVLQQQSVVQNSYANQMQSQLVEEVNANMAQALQHREQISNMHSALQSAGDQQQMLREKEEQIQTLQTVVPSMNSYVNNLAEKLQDNVAISTRQKVQIEDKDRELMLAKSALHAAEKKMAEMLIEEIQTP